MRTGLSLNTRHTAKCIMAVLSLLCIANFTAGAQSRGFSASFSGGVSKVFNSGDNSPFINADKGGYIQLSGMRPVGKNWGIVINLDHSFLDADNTTTANYFLHNDANAESVTVQSGNFNMTNAGIGIYYDWNFSDKLFIRFAPVIGYSYLQTPQTDVSVDTEPHTTYTYNAGSSSALFYALHIRPALNISKRCTLFADMSYSYARYKFSGLLAKEVFDKTIHYGKLNAGFGFQYSFSAIK